MNYLQKTDLFYPLAVEIEVNSHKSACGSHFVLIKAHKCDMLLDWRQYLGYSLGSSFVSILTDIAPRKHFTDSLWAYN